MHSFRLLVTSPYLLWIVLALPAAFMLAGYWRETLVYGEIVHASGEMGARLLIVTMAATPLALGFPRAALPRWLLRHRRALGVASFGYTLLHAVVYLQRQEDLSRIVEDAPCHEIVIRLLSYGNGVANDTDTTTNLHSLLNALQRSRVTGQRQAHIDDGRIGCHGVKRHRPTAVDPRDSRVNVALGK